MSDDVKRINADDLPGMKERELVGLGPCAVCGKPQLAHGDVTFYVIEVSRGIFDPTAIMQRAGVEMQMGPLARLFSPDKDLAKIIDGPRRVFVAEKCAAMISHPLELIAGRTDRAAS